MTRECHASASRSSPALPPAASYTLCMPQGWQPVAFGSGRGTSHRRLLMSKLLPRTTKVDLTRTLGVCQPGQQAAPRPAAADGLGAQDRPVEHRHADDAVTG